MLVLGNQGDFLRVPTMNQLLGLRGREHVAGIFVFFFFFLFSLVLNYFLKILFCKTIIEKQRENKAKLSSVPIS